jgi:hypothetical protein
MEPSGGPVTGRRSGREVEGRLSAGDGENRAARARACQPDPAVAGVAPEVDEDAFGAVLDRNDVGWTEKEDGAALLAVHREHWPVSKFELRTTEVDDAGWLGHAECRRGDQLHKTRVPALAYKNKSSYDRFRL